MKIYKKDDQIKLRQGERHRLIGLEDFCSVLVFLLIGGSIGNNMDIPQNLWWMREIIKIGVTIVAMYTIQIIRLQIYNFRNNT